MTPDTDLCPRLPRSERAASARDHADGDGVPYPLRWDGREGGRARSERAARLVGRSVAPEAGYWPTRIVPDSIS